MKKTTSLRKIAANRRNAARSTGPKTRAGKEIVRWNALKHGLLTEAVLIRAGDGRESPSEFQGLLASLQDELHPEGALEEMLVEKIAVCYWRLRRVLRCEVGEIRKELDTVLFDQAAQAERAVEDTLSWPSYSGKGKDRGLCRTSAGIEHLLKIIEGLRYDIVNHGQFCENAREEMLEVCGSADGTLGRELSYYNWLATEDGQNSPREEGEVVPGPDECAKIILQRLSEEEKRLRGGLKVIRDHEALKADSLRERLSLPSADTTERILRYETTLERQLYRAINQLERLQGRRRGDPVPPTLVVDVTNTN